jgi:hypothetical protein
MKAAKGKSNPPDKPQAWVRVFKKPDGWYYELEVVYMDSREVWTYDPVGPWATKAEAARMADTAGAMHERRLRRT